MMQDIARVHSTVGLKRYHNVYFMRWCEREEGKLYNSNKRKQGETVW